ncbi:hypothetical protein D3C86_2005580 [compost metagenome]
MVKTVAAESESNRRQIETWIAHWSARALEALAPLAEISAGAAALDSVHQDFLARLNKLGLNIQ